MKLSRLVPLLLIGGGAAWVLTRRASVPPYVPAKPGEPTPGLPDPGSKASGYPGASGPATPPSSWVQMPTGPLWSVRDPARSWGTPATIAALTAALSRYSARAPALGLGGTPVRVLDLSKQGGGQLGAHKSHQEGRDVDLSFPGSVLEPVATPVLLRALLEDSAVQAIFLSWKVQGQIWDALEVNPELDPGGLVRSELQYPLAPGTGHTRVRHWAGHQKHLHVRYRA